MATNKSYVPRFPRTITPQDSVTRPADTTQYAAGDAISDNATTPTTAGYFLFPMLRNGQSGRFVGMTLHKSDHDATTASFAMLLFTSPPAVGGWEDNAALAITDAEMLACEGVVSFPAASLVNVVTGDIYSVTCDIGFVCDSDDSNIYGILVAADTYTPASGEVFSAKAHVVLD